MKESKELILALVVVGKFVVDRVKDGVDLGDAAALADALMKDGEFKSIVEAGYKDAEKISEEFKDFGLAKGFELAGIIPELIKVLQPQVA